MNRLTLLVLMGLPGAGKTTVARWLADHLGFEVVSRDSIRSSMFPLCSFTDAEKDAAYSAMKAAIGVALQLGRNVVTDGMCFSNEPQLEEVEAIGRLQGAHVIALHCSCDLATAIARVRDDHISGVHPALDRDEELVRSVAARFRPVPRHVIPLQTDRSIGLIGADLVALLEGQT